MNRSRDGLHQKAVARSLRSSREDSALPHEGRPAPDVHAPDRKYPLFRPVTGEAIPAKPLRVTKTEKMMSEVLNCDADGCGHVESVGKITADMVNMPCPKCGANLLTEEDWQAWQPFSDLLGILNNVADGEATKAADAVTLKVGLHGKTTKIEIERP